MKHYKIVIALASLFLFAACGKHPSSMVGVWKNGEEGFFSAQLILSLKSDGTGSLSASSLFGGEGGKSTWEFSKDTLTVNDAGGGGSMVFNIVSKSKTHLLLNETSSGRTLTFARVSDE